MTQARPLRVAVTAGDPAGIGPRVRERALERLGGLGGVEFVPIGEADPKLPARPTAEGGQRSLAWLEEAVRLALAGEVDAICTGPVSKEAWALAGSEHRGQTELLMEAAGAERVLMTFVGGGLRVALATRHVPLRRVPDLVDAAGLLADLRLFHGGLQVDFGCEAPRILVCGLNPHAGEGGLLGREEIESVTPAVERARAEGVLAFGPVAADTAFVRALRGGAEGVLALYHDQGLAPFKVRTFGRGAQTTLGLPFVRTSPDHGTAFDRARGGEVDSGSMERALLLAVRLARRRRARSRGRPLTGETG